MTHFHNKLNFFFLTTLALITFLKVLSISGREEKRLPFFGLVRIPNQICNATNDQSTGVCYSRRQCERVGGVEAGSCAAGYGTCCLVVTNECTSGVAERVEVNGTHLVNPMRAPNSNFCQYIFPKKRNVCQVRLDFVKLVIDGPSASALMTSRDCDRDTLTITGASNTKFVGQLCGNMTGQHVYLDYGMNSEINMDIFTVSNNLQSWDIKVTYIKCDSVELAPEGCLQYLTGQSGMVKSLNFNSLVQTNNQDYSICIRPVTGMNRITWSTCGNCDNDFHISREGATCPPEGSGLPIIDRPGSGDDCVTDWVMVFGKNKYCGNAFPDSVTSTSKPFLLQVHFDDQEFMPPPECIDPPTGCRDLDNTGFCLVYKQSP